MDIASRKGRARGRRWRDKTSIRIFGHGLPRLDTVQLRGEVLEVVVVVSNGFGDLGLLVLEQAHGGLKRVDVLH